MRTLGNVPLILRRALMVAVGIVLVGLGGCTDKPVPTGADPTAGPEWLSTPFRLDPLDVIACRYGGTWPDCKLAPAPSGPPAPTAPAGPTGGNEGTSVGGSGGGSTPPPTPPDSVSRDTCATNIASQYGDDILGSRVVQNAFAVLWTTSNASDPDPSRRLEQGGWIIRNQNGGYSFQPFADVTFTPCAIIPQNGFAPVPPSGAVSWVHTHVFRRGERLTPCPPDYDANGRPYIDVYGGTPSMDDQIVSDNINAMLAQRGDPPMDRVYVLDHEGILRFRSVGGGMAIPFTTVPRCGY